MSEVKPYLSYKDVMDCRKLYKKAVQNLQERCATKDDFMKVSKENTEDLRNYIFELMNCSLTFKRISEAFEKEHPYNPSGEIFWHIFDDSLIDYENMNQYDKEALMFDEEICNALKPAMESIKDIISDKTDKYTKEDRELAYDYGCNMIDVIVPLLGDRGLQFAEAWAETDGYSCLVYYLCTGKVDW